MWQKCDLLLFVVMQHEEKDKWCIGVNCFASILAEILAFFDFLTCLKQNRYVIYSQLFSKGISSEKTS